jgi:hypothetical protein
MQAKHRHIGADCRYAGTPYRACHRRRRNPCAQRRADRWVGSPCKTRGFVCLPISGSLVCAPTEAIAVRHGAVVFATVQMIRKGLLASF